jgi:hypothetical protein
MKKIFSILIFSLFLTGSAYAKIIIFKKCLFVRESDFNYGRFETFEYRFDTTKMNGVRIWLHTDKYVKENPGEKKIYTKPYKIIHADNDYIIAHTSTQKLEAVLNTKTVTLSHLEPITEGERRWNTTHRCE